MFGGDEAEERDQLEEQMRAVMDKYKYKRRQNRELSEDLQVWPSHFNGDMLCRPPLHTHVICLRDCPRSTVDSALGL